MHTTPDLNDRKRSALDLLAASLLLLIVSTANADAPLAPAAAVSQCNSSRSYCAVSDPASSTTVIRLTESGQSGWSVPRYFRFFTLAPDGAALVALSDFGNLAPLDATGDTELFSIYREGRLLRVVRVADLFASPSDMPQTSSHRAWGYLTSITADVVWFELSSGGKVSYNLHTGARER